MKTNKILVVISVALAICLVFAVSKCNSNKPTVQVKYDVGSKLECGFSDKYNSCFCFDALGWDRAMLTWVPKEVCGK